MFKPKIFILLFILSFFLFSSNTFAADAEPKEASPEVTLEAKTEESSTAKAEEVTIDKEEESTVADDEEDEDEEPDCD